MQLCYIKHEQKKNAFNQEKKKTVPLLLSCSLTLFSQASNFDVMTLFLFVFLFFFSRLFVVQFLFC